MAWPKGKPLSDEHRMKVRDARLRRERGESAPADRASQDVRLRNRFGITITEYDELFARQNGVCAICKQPSPHKALSVDHDHVTKEIRGLLCQRCNMPLTQHLIDHLDEVVRYLRGGDPCQS